MAPNTNLKDIMTKTPTTDFFIACKESRIESNTSFYGCFYLGPFDESLSQTLANDLRRTLLSELTGLAITSVEIEGVLHKFSSLPGMKESVLDLICNLQSIVLKKQEISSDSSLLSVRRPTKKTYMGFLNVNGPRVIKAMDLKLPAGLQCVDPNQYIATLADDGTLNMKFNINEGKNFIKQKHQNLDVTTLKKRNILLQNFKKKINLPTNGVFNSENKNKKLPLSMLNGQPKKLSNPIPLDAVFMPVTKINCIIEENNLYSDFSTDSPNLFTQTSSRTSNQINTKTLNTFFHFIDYNSIYQTSLLLKNTNKNTFGQNQKYTKSDNKFKLIPWHSNSLYFNITDGLKNKPWLEEIGNTQDVSNRNVTKIHTFLGSKPSLILKKTVPTKVPHGLFYSLKAKEGQMTKLNTVSQKAQALLNSGIVTRYSDVKTGLKEHYKSYQINTVSALNQDSINLEYAKILKLKPLRKKSNLIVEIWTNGSIHPRQALYDCFTFLSNNFLKLQTVKMIGSTFKSELSYGNLKYSYLSNYNKRFANTSNRITNFNFSDQPLLTTQSSKLMMSGIFTNTHSQETILKTVSVKTTELEKTPTPKAVDGISSSRINQMNPILQASLKAPVGILKISLRAYTALKKAGIFTVKDLINKSKTDLLKIKNVGIKSVAEIEISLAYLGLTLK